MHRHWSMLDTIRICWAVWSVPAVADGSERKETKKSDEMQRLLASPHWRLKAHLRCAICWDSHMQPNPTTNLSAWTAVTFSKLPSKHTLSSGGDVTFILSCTGDMGILLLFFSKCVQLCCPAVKGQLGIRVAHRGKYHRCAKLAGMNTNRTHKQRWGVRQAG